MTVIVTAYHNTQSRLSPYSHGDHLQAVARHTLAHAAAGTDPVSVADWAFHAFNADLDLLEAGRGTPAGEAAYLAACHYRLHRLRSLSTGDIVMVRIGERTHWLSCEPIGWLSVTEPTNRTDTPPTAEDVYRRLAPAQPRRGRPSLDATLMATLSTAPPLSAAAIAAAGTDTDSVLAAFKFLTDTARLAGVDHVDHWQLHHHHDASYPWRIVDTGATETPGWTTTTVAVLLKALSTVALVTELEVRAETLRGVWELRDRGWSIDLTAPARRPPTT